MTWKFHWIRFCPLPFDRFKEIELNQMRPVSSSISASQWNGGGQWALPLLLFLAVICIIIGISIVAVPVIVIVIVAIKQR